MGKAFFISITLYLLFFYPLLNEQIYLGGEDSRKFYYPARYYLNQSLQNSKFPFWTERIFSGYPIYADTEGNYLSPINLILIYLFGPFNSYKILHFGFYLIGSISFYLFLKKKGVTIFGYAAANMIFYFSFFHLYHQQHFNFTLSTYLIPFTCLIMEKFIETKRMKWLMFHAFVLANILAFGSFQAVLINLVISFLYYFIHAFGMFKLRSFILHLIIYFSFLLFLTLPVLIPAAQLYFNSQRLEYGSNIFTQGSFNPLMLSNLIFPYLFGTDESYKWNTINSDYLIHETYIYIGVSTAILLIISLCLESFIKQRRFKVFILFCIWLFLIFGFISYIPVLRNIPIPIFSLFRYWGRSAVFLLFGTSCAVASFLSLDSFDKPKIKFSALTPFVFYFIFLFAVNLNNSYVIATINIFKAGAFKLDTVFYIWLLLALLTTLVLYVSYKYSKNMTGLFLILIFLDLMYFGRAPAFRYLRNLSDIIPLDNINRTLEFKDQRIVVNDSLYFWNYALYYSSWGVFGYSQYVPGNYEDMFKELQIKGTKVLTSFSTINNFKELGVTRFIQNNNITVLQNSPDDLFKPFNGRIRNLNRSEGHFDLDVESDNSQKLQTRIKNYPGWEVELDDTKTPILNKNDVYISFMIPKGETHIHMEFIPKVFYFSILISLFGLFFSWLLLWKKITNIF